MPLYIGCTKFSKAFWSCKYNSEIIIHFSFAPYKNSHENTQVHQKNSKPYGESTPDIVINGEIDIAARIPASDDSEESEEENEQEDIDDIESMIGDNKVKDKDPLSLHAIGDDSNSTEICQPNTFPQSQHKVVEENTHIISDRTNMEHVQDTENFDPAPVLMSLTAKKKDQDVNQVHYC